jgi:hypothetical protein
MRKDTLSTDKKRTWDALHAFVNYILHKPSRTQLDRAVAEAVSESRLLRGFVEAVRPLAIFAIDNMLYDDDECWGYPVHSESLAGLQIPEVMHAEIFACPKRAEAIALERPDWSRDTDLLVDRTTERVWFRGAEVELTFRQFSILYAVLKNHARVSMDRLTSTLVDYNGVDSEDPLTKEAILMAMASLRERMGKSFRLENGSGKYCLRDTSFLLIDERA